jgi:ubiquinone/menaquinone biosynthesis C-methylase UbiE
VANWVYDEFKHIGVDFADPQQVQTYDERQQTSVEAEKRLVARLNITLGAHLIEFGPGTGAFSFVAALAGAQVISVDISQAMLSYGRARAERAGLTNIQFVQSGFLSYQHEGAPADFVVTKFAFHHLPDFWKALALRRIYDSLKPGGVFFLRDVVFSFQPQDAGSEIERWIGSVASEGGSGFSRADFEMHVRDEYSTFGWLL